MRAGIECRVDRSEDGDPLGLTKNAREAWVHSFNGGSESGQFVDLSDSRRQVPRYSQDSWDDLERLKSEE